MKRLLLLMMVAALATGIQAGTVLIDYDDGTVDGIHDASIANGGFEDTNVASGEYLAFRQDADNSAGDIPGKYYSYFSEASATDATPSPFLWDSGGQDPGDGSNNRTAVNGWSGSGDRRQVFAVGEGWSISDGDSFHLEFSSDKGSSWENSDDLQVRVYTVDKSSGYVETEITSYLTDLIDGDGKILLDVDDGGAWTTHSLDLTIDYDTMGDLSGQQIGFRIFGSGDRGDFCKLDNFYLTADVVPEPATLVLLGLGSLMAICRRQ